MKIKNEDDYQEFMDLQEVADYLKIHINTLYKLIRLEENPLPTIQISERILRIKKSELDEWLEYYDYHSKL